MKELSLLGELALTLNLTESVTPNYSSNAITLVSCPTVLCTCHTCFASWLRKKIEVRDLQGVVKGDFVKERTRTTLIPLLCHLSH